MGIFFFKGGGYFWRIILHIAKKKKELSWHKGNKNDLLIYDSLSL